MLSPELKYVGTTITFNNEFTDSDGFYIDPESVSLSVLSPEGTETNYLYPTTIVRDGTGLYHADMAPDRGGVWYYRWQVSSGTAVLAMEGDFIVQESPFKEGRRDVYRE